MILDFVRSCRTYMDPDLRAHPAAAEVRDTFAARGAVPGSPARPLLVLALLLGLAACDLGSGPGDYSASDFYGEWSMSVPATDCWPTLDIVFLIDAGGIDTPSGTSAAIDGRWGVASTQSRNLVMTGFLNWREPRTFSFAFYESGSVLGMFTGAEEGFGSSRFEGSFFDPDNSACSASVVATK